MRLRHIRNGAGEAQRDCVLRKLRSMPTPNACAEVAGRLAQGVFDPLTAGVVVCLFRCLPIPVGYYPPVAPGHGDSPPEDAPLNIRPPRVDRCQKIVCGSLRVCFTMGSEHARGHRPSSSAKLANMLVTRDRVCKQSWLRIVFVFRRPSCKSYCPSLLLTASRQMPTPSRHSPT